ncbi:MAG: hypothetical protein A2252_12065 [Elusimicrobia bacterium RIFOXYA2_FULL_39_19]|nr:MAG: hypothetical protein A2252_12065 [Elusimicrobia bacterium RIFOXYA2_FULL_39_19]
MNKQSKSIIKKSEEVQKKEQIITIQKKDIWRAIYDSLIPDPIEGSKKTRNNLICNFIEQGINKHNISKQYNIIIFHDEGTMVKSDADNIYSTANSFNEKKPLLLVLYSTGGEIGSAYLISKLCREYSNGKFVVVVPRQAKSAATLICCGADEIHMGSLSELGPIDPQINRLPALGLKNSVEHIAELVSKYPQSSEMFAKYLKLSLAPVNLGYYERVAQSAAQYAERLLKLRSSKLKNKHAKIAEGLVYSYKDHGFVIDKGEAEEIFGNDTIKTNTDEYKLGNEIYESLIYISRVANSLDHYFYHIGSSQSEPIFNKKLD